MNYLKGHGEAVCRAALARGVLRRTGRQGGHWQFGQRVFNNLVVNKLIANGEAVRVGDVVFAVSNGGSNEEK